MLVLVLMVELLEGVQERVAKGPALSIERSGRQPNLKGIIRPLGSLKDEEGGSAKGDPHYPFATVIV